jgi:acetyl-CoA carboxylase carboxyl transferase subunit beta
VTGTAAIAGTPVVLIVLDFGFMGGTMGCAVGEKVTLALERAVKRGLSTVAIVTSGGARIQEGVLSLMQMAKTAGAANRLNEAGLPFVTVLANPATGQAYGSFANLADIILAEPGSIVGFSSLRVIKRASDQPLPTGAHSAESHMAHGMLDAVVQRTELRTIIGVLVELLGTRYQLANLHAASRPQTTIARPEAWTSVQMARHEERPTSADYLSRIFSQFVELHGDRAYGDDSTIISGLGQIAGQTVAVIAQQRVAPLDQVLELQGESRTMPEGFRKAHRAMNLAKKFSLPLITLIDTSGPDLSVAAEERGLGNTIATAMAQMSGLSVPTISVVIGQAGSGGALALGIADRALMLEHAIYTAVSPEEAAEVIYQDASRAEEAASSMRLTAHDCLELGIIDSIVAEPPNGAHADPDEAARTLGRAIVSELARLQARSPKKRTSERYSKYRSMGVYSSHIKVTIAREVNAVQNMIRSGLDRLSRVRHRRHMGADDLDRVSGNGYFYGADD